MHAIPRTRDAHGFVRPEARMLDSLRTALFDDIPLPLAPVLPAEQLALGFDDADAEPLEDDEDAGAQP